MANPLLDMAAAAARLLPAPFKRALYQLGPLSRGLRNALNRSAPHGLSEMKVAAGGLAGGNLMLDMQSEKDYWLGTYEMDLQQAITDWAKPAMIAYDLGANIGYVSLLLSRAVGPTGKVIAFEALPANQERLKSNFQLNPSENIELVRRAVADKTGTSIFIVHKSGGMGKLSDPLGHDNGDASRISVETVAVDDFIYKNGNPKPDLIKIDIEGGEVLALRGMAQLLKEKRPLLFIELHGKHSAGSVWQILNEAGYSLHFMRKEYPKVRHPQEFGKKNYIVARPNGG